MNPDTLESILQTPRVTLIPAPEPQSFTLAFHPHRLVGRVANICMILGMMIGGYCALFFLTNKTPLGNHIGNIPLPPSLALNFSGAVAILTAIFHVGNTRVLRCNAADQMFQLWWQFTPKPHQPFSDKKFPFHEIASFDVLPKRNAFTLCLATKRGARITFGKLPTHEGAQYLASHLNGLLSKK